jgi:glycine betaine/choline ABC-type transport system substrate-binding protein
MVRIAIALITLLSVGCTRGPRQIVVASKNFTEQLVLGEIIAQQLEQRGIGVERRLNLGGTLLAHQALVSGGIDLYPEYTGTALTTVLKLDRHGNAAEVRKRVADEYMRRWRLSWIAPLGFNNTFAMTIRGELPYTTLSEAAAGRAWRLGTGYEFLQRPDGLPGLVRTYGLKLQGDPVTMDLALLYRALESRQVDMVAGSSTDAQLSALNVRVLRDDHEYFPPYECAIVVREEAMNVFPQLRAALAELEGAIDDTTMRRLNYEAEGRKRATADVAAEFLLKRRSR